MKGKIITPKGDKATTPKGGLATTPKGGLHGNTKEVTEAKLTKAAMKKMEKLNLAQSKYFRINYKLTFVDAVLNEMALAKDDVLMTDTMVPSEMPVPRGLNMSGILA